MDKKNKTRKISFCCPHHGSLDEQVEYFSTTVGNKRIVDVPLMICRDCQKYYTPFANLLALTRPQYKGYQIVASQGRGGKSFFPKETREPRCLDIREEQDQRRGENMLPNNTKNLKGYKMEPLRSANLQAIKKRIFLKNFACSECPICHKHLMEYVNILPISKTDGVKVPGRYCSKCEIFWEDRGTTLYNLIQKLPNSSDYEVNSEYVIPEYLQKTQFTKTLKSTSVVIHLKTKDASKHTMIVIVSSCSDRNCAKNVLHYTDPEARKLLFAIHHKNMLIQLGENEYEILRYSFAKQKANDIPDYMNISKIVLYPGGESYRDFLGKDIEAMDILLYSPFTNCFEVASASYDEKNRCYYMSISMFRKYVLKFGNPGIEVLLCESFRRNDSSVREESFLHAYGYSVAQDAGLTTRKRQSLLGEVLDLGLMNAYNIICLLEYNIKMHSEDKYMIARSRWNADKEFVMNYKVDRDRFVVLGKSDC